MHQTAATWLQVLAWVSLGVAFLCAGAILVDIVVRRDRPSMTIMGWVWPITALYWGPVALWGWRTRGRRDARWWSTSKGVSHCGAGCTLGDIAGEWIMFATALTIGGFAWAAVNELIAMYVLDFAFAWTLGIAFQYFSIVPMRDDVGRGAGIWAAIKADTLSIVAFQVGLFGWMALFHLVLWQPPLTIAGPTYWFMMQIGMVIGFFTAWPVNAWLIRRGWKEEM